MFQNFLSLNENQKISLSYSIACTDEPNYSVRPLVSDKLNEQGPVVDCEMKKEILTSLNRVWVGATECVCWRFLANWWFVRGDHETYNRVYLLSPPSAVSRRWGFSSLSFSPTQKPGDKLRGQLTDEDKMLQVQ